MPAYSITRLSEEFGFLSSRLDFGLTLAGIYVGKKVVTNVKANLPKLLD